MEHDLEHHPQHGKAGRARPEPPAPMQAQAGVLGRMPLPTGPRARWRSALSAAALALALASGAVASAGDLASPGPCAEPDRRAVSPDPEPGYAVAGPPGARFDAADVAAPPLAVSVPAPPAPRFPGVGPCERAASACGEAALRRPQGASFPPVGPPPLP